MLIVDVLPQSCQPMALPQSLVKTKPKSKSAAVCSPLLMQQEKEIMCGGELGVGEQDEGDALLRNQNGPGPEIE